MKPPGAASSARATETGSKRKSPGRIFDRGSLLLSWLPSHHGLARPAPLAPHRNRLFDLIQAVREEVIREIIRRRFGLVEIREHPGRDRLDHPRHHERLG